MGRALSHSDKEALGPFIMQSLLILVAPALYAASIYMVLGRIIRLLDAEEYSIIRTKWLTKVFVIGDVFSFLVQSSGADGYIITHEWMLYIFDAVFMLSVTVSFLVLHPSKLLGNGRIPIRNESQLYAMESGRSQVSTHHVYEVKISRMNLRKKSPIAPRTRIEPTTSKIRCITPNIPD